MTHQALARQWRPKDFSTVIGQPFVVQALTNALNQNRLHHAYLFTGTRGVGKTTIARILAKCLNCDTGITATPCGNCQACTSIDAGRFPDLFEIDAASRTKVEDTREILDNVQYAPTIGRYKIYLIDEVHMLSGHSFNALLKTLEEPPEHVKFLLATTDPQKLPVTVLSRCLQFHLSLVSVDDIAAHLTHILDVEKIPAEPDALRLIGDAAKGSLRDALSLLDQCIAFGNQKVTTTLTQQLLGTVDSGLIHQLLHALSAQDGDAVLQTCATLYEHGIDFTKALAELLSQLHAISCHQLTQQKTSSSTLATLADQFSPEDIQLLYQIGLIGQRDLPLAPTPRNGFEMTMLRMLAFTPLDTSTQSQQHPQRSAQTKAPKQTTQTARPSHSTASKPAPAPSISGSDDWHTLFQSLNLTGAARMLAEQCTMVSKTEQKITLALNAKHKALRQDALIKRIQTSIQAHFQRPIELLINLTDNTVDNTPRDAAKEAAKQRQAAAEANIYGDAQVQQILKTFDASVVKNSIKPVIPDGDNS